MPSYGSFIEKFVLIYMYMYWDTYGFRLYLLVYVIWKYMYIHYL